MELVSYEGTRAAKHLGNRYLKNHLFGETLQVEQNGIFNQNYRFEYEQEYSIK